jgi:hypothetical protein
MFLARFFGSTVDLRGLALIFFALAGGDVAATPVTQPVALSLDSAADADAGTARIVGAMLDYTRWPGPRPVVHLCLAGAPRHAARLADIALSNGARLHLSSLNDQGDLRTAGCDALYIGRIGDGPMRTLLAGAHGQPVVTIAEDDPDCRSGAIFCLLYTPRSLSFQLNIDAISRAAVRIDPRVLRLSHGGD